MANEPTPQSATRATKGIILPGMAMISIYMLVVAIVGGFGAFRGLYPAKAGNVILPVCSLIVIGVFGFLRLQRWGWALVCGGCLTMSLWYMYVARTVHNPAMYIMAGFDLCFFLYLVRTEVRNQLRSPIAKQGRS